MTEFTMKDPWYKRGWGRFTIFYKEHRAETLIVGSVVLALLAWMIWAMLKSREANEHAVPKQERTVAAAAVSAPSKPAVVVETKVETAPPATLNGKPVTSATNVLPPDSTGKLIAPSDALLPRESVVAPPPPPPAPKVKKARGKAKSHQAAPARAPDRPAVEKNAKGEFVWRHFGAAPYARTKAEALKNPEPTLRALGVSECAIPELVKALRQPGKRILLGHGDRLDAMLSKGGVVHKNVVIDFEKPPSHGMAYAAWAESWTVTCGGKTEEVVLPEVCNNLSLRVIRLPVVRASVPSEPSGCYEIAFSAEQAPYVNWGTATNRGPFPADECNAQRQGDLPWVAWYGDCPDCVPESYREQRVPVPHHFRYPVTRKAQVLRFSKAVLESVVYLCVGETACGIYVRPEDWKGKHRIDISDAMLAAARDCR